MRHILNMMLASICLLNVWLVVLGNAEEYPVSDYINVNRFTAYDPDHLAMVRYVVDTQGGESPEDAVQLLQEMIIAIKRELPEELDKFGLKDYKKLAGVEEVVERLIDLSEQKCDRSTVDFFVKTIMHVFGRDLKDFVKADPKFPDSKMTIFLRHYGMKELSACLQSAVDPRTLTVRSEEAKLDKIIARDEDIVNQRNNDKLLIAEAKELDLLRGKFDGRAMLNTFDSDIDRFSESGVRANVRLGREIMFACRIFEDQFRYKLDIYNIARLSIPDEVEKLSLADRFIKLNEYMRICISISNPNLTHALYNNIQRNMRSSLLSCFRH